MIPLIPILICLAVLLMIVAIWYFNGKNVLLRTLKKIPHKTVGAFKTNEKTQVTGKALHVKEPLIAPFSKRKCIFYSIKIEQKKSNGKNSYWKTLVKEEDIQEFFIDTQGDFVIVEPQKHPKNFISHLVVDKTHKSGTFNDPTPEFRSLLKRYHIESETFFGFNKQLRYSEGIIEIGELITVAGLANFKSLKEPIPEYPYSKIATLIGNEKEKLIITDLPEARLEKQRKP